MRGFCWVFGGGGRAGLHLFLHTQALFLAGIGGGGDLWWGFLSAAGCSSTTKCTQRPDGDRFNTRPFKFIPASSSFIFLKGPAGKCLCSLDIMKPDVLLNQVLSPLQIASGLRANLSLPRLRHSLFGVREAGLAEALHLGALTLPSIMLKVKCRARLHPDCFSDSQRLSQQQNKLEDQRGFAG